MFLLSGNLLHLDNMYIANQLCEMMEFLIDNIFVRFGGDLLRQVTGIPVGTNCTPPPPPPVLTSFCILMKVSLENMIRCSHMKVARSIIYISMMYFVQQ